MKINEILIHGFRGAPISTSLQLNSKSTLLVAENGYGKTTFVDAIEFWCTGDVRGFHRQGYGLDAIINLDNDGAMVTCTIAGEGPRTRKIERTGSRVTLTPEPVTGNLVEIPILRHRTMAEFMDRSPGEKKKVLLELLGLEMLTDFRDTLRSASGDAKRETLAADSTLRGETQALKTKCANKPLLEVAEQLRTKASLVSPITTENDLLELQLTPIPTPAIIDYPEMVAQLDRTRDLSSVRLAITEWNNAQSDTNLIVQATLSELLRAGSRILESWPEENCPLCRQDIAKAELASDLTRRLFDLQGAEERLRELRSGLEDSSRRILSLLSALENLENNPPEGGWAERENFGTAISTLKAISNSISSASISGIPCLPMPEIVIPNSSNLLENADITLSRNTELQAIADLVSLRDQKKRVLTAKKAFEAAKDVQNDFEAFLNETDLGIQKEIQAALKELGDLISEYYNLLRNSPLFGNIELIYTSERSGGIEFEVKFDDRHSVTPPQRVMSESQLNSLGLALFLARLKHEDQKWRFFVLDDVVNSFDSDHRLGLARLLADNFEEWQVLMFTHDRYFQSICREILNKWENKSIGAWTVSGGPVISAGASRDLLAERLKEGRTAAELGGLARIALEEGLTRPLEKLRLKIHYDPLGRYTAKQYLDALRGGLKASSNKALKDLPILKRMSAEAYMTNLAAHYKPIDPNPSTTDLNNLLRDLKELDATFRCSSCNCYIWDFENTSQHRLQCKCSAMEF